MVTTAQLKRLFPRARADLIRVIVDNWHEAAGAGITTPNRIADFFAQIGTETGELTALAESLNYTVDALKKKFGRHRISIADCEKYGRRPGRPADQKAIANILYGGEWGRKNLGNTEPNDGWDMRGGGMMQTTGRAGYRRMGFEADPEALREPLTAFRTAIREWDKRGCNARADRGDTRGNRKAINGGAMGLDECLKLYARAKAIFAAPATRLGLFSAPIEEAAEPDGGEVYTDKHRVTLAQTYLRNLGYAEVGDLDGEIGTFTRDAIRSYRAAKGLPPGDHIDFLLMGTLATDNQPRQLSDARANASAAAVRAKVPEAKANFLAKVWSGFTAAGAGLIAFGNGVMSNVTAAKGYLDPVKEFLGDVPPWAWALAVLLIAVVIYRSAAAGERASIVAVQTGARR